MTPRGTRVYHSLAMSVRYVFLGSLVAIIACAHHSDTATAAGAAAIPRTAKFLVASEIVAAHADATTLYDTIARLRPNWLAAHGSSSLTAGGSDYAVVYVDGHRYGELESLRNIESFQVANVRYYDVTEAGAMFGVRGGTGGVIDVKMK